MAGSNPKIREQIIAVQKWNSDQSDIITPPNEIDIWDTRVRRAIYHLIGGRHTRQGVPNVEDLCREHPELKEFRQSVMDKMRDGDIHHLSELCAFINEEADKLDPKLAKYIHRFQLLGAIHIRRSKTKQLEKNGFGSPADLKKWGEIQARLTKITDRAVGDIISQRAHPAEAMMEMLAAMSAVVYKETKEYRESNSPELQMMQDKAFHSIRECMDGIAVLEQPNTVAVWGSARSDRCYDVITNEVMYQSAHYGISGVSGGGPGTMGAALSGTRRFIDEKLEKGEDPGVEAIGLPGNFAKLNEEPSDAMTMRVDHYDLDIRKLLLRTNKCVLIEPGRAGTDQEFYDGIVELLTDYSNIIEKPGAIVPNLVVVGDDQRALLLRHVIIEMNKWANKHLDGRPLFYYVPVDHEKLKEEENLPNQLEGEETKRLIKLLTEINIYLCQGDTQRHLCDAGFEGVIDSIELRKQFLENPLVDMDTLKQVMGEIEQREGPEAERAHAVLMQALQGRTLTEKALNSRAYRKK